MYGLPETIKCHQCGVVNDTDFYESSMFEFDDGHVKVHLYCGNCEGDRKTCEWWYEFDVSVKNVEINVIE